MSIIKGGKFGEIKFNLDTGWDCCGQCVVHDLVVKPNFYMDWRTNKRTELDAWATREEQIQGFYSSLFSALEDKTADYFTDYEDDDDDNRSAYCYAFLTMTLIKGPEEQIPGMIDFLLEKGWKIDQEGVNPKTQNTIVHMSYKL